MDRFERVALNESRFRAVNEKLVEQEDPSSTQLVILCECGDEDCRVRIGVSRAEYEEARSEGVLFLVRREHEQPGVEEVIRSEGDHRLVRKTGEGARVADQHDPRTGT